MARICGVFSSHDIGYRLSLVQRMLKDLSLQKSWQHWHTVAGSSALGVTGWRQQVFSTLPSPQVVIDGMIFNLHEFSTAPDDAGTIIALYETYGFRGMLQRINGDFAFALYDSTRNKLFVGRDRFGIKPLYYTCTPEFFAFSSQPRALCCLPGVGAEPNHQFIALFAGSHYRVFDNDPDASPYAKIAQLPAAHMLEVSPEGVKKVCYWALEELPDFTEPEPELAQRYRDLLRDAVALRLRRAEKPAFTLSGGMDSSSVLGCAVHKTGTQQHAFSTVYRDKTYDEADDIKPMLATHVAQWHPVRVDNPDVLGIVQRMIEVHDEPVATATWLSHFLLCEQAAKQGCRSLFGGLGGDELNAGEYEYFFYHFADLQQAGANGRLDREITLWARYHDHPLYKKNHAVAFDALMRLTDPHTPGRCRPDRIRLERYRNALNRDFFDLSGFEPVMDHPFGSYLKNRTYQDMTRETIPCCLRAEDRQCTAFGLDNCVPFFDHRLVEFMFRVPGTMKIRDGITKRLLRKAMRGILPEETRTRIKKTGWNAPAHVWFSGKGLDAVRDLVSSPRFRERGIYNVPEVLRLIEEHEHIVTSGIAAENHMMFLWQLVNIELWLEHLPTGEG